MKKVHEKVLTNDISQTQVVTLAVYLLQGDSKIIDTEDVAIKAAELAPGRFSWKKYPDQVNLELVRVNLSNAKKAEYGMLVDGTGRRGWSLTPAGIDWVKEIGRFLQDEDLSWSRRDSDAGGIDEVRWRRERDRVVGSSAWQKWLDRSKEISLIEAQEVFRIDSYSVGRLRNVKINRLCRLFENDNEIVFFLNSIKNLVLEEGQGNHE